MSVELVYVPGYTQEKKLFGGKGLCMVLGYVISDSNSGSPSIWDATVSDSCFGVIYILE